MSARIALVGGPRVGKTTLARTLGRSLMVPIRSTDEVAGLGWSEASEAASKWFGEGCGGFVIEGVAVARALRKWLKANPTGKPCDRVLYLTKVWEPLKDGQRSMSKGCKTVFDEIRPALEARGVEIIEGEAPALETQVPESGVSRVAS